jgi:hypothetical protein
MARTSGIIALLTDFGLKDPYVGVMKGVILRINPEARIVDLSHDIPPQGILDAYFLLSNTYRYFPDGTLFLAVVDPGVGSDRNILAVETDAYAFLAPDNGILGFLQKEGKVRRAVYVQNRKYALAPVSNTFHGRDIFAPAAAHLSRGLDLAKLGPETERIHRIVAPAPRISREGVLTGEVVSIDRFGNLVTNIPGEPLASADAVEVRIGKTTIDRLARSYADGKKGALFAIVGSTGNLEISVNKGDAREKTGAEVGDAVRVRHSQK